MQVSTPRRWMLDSPAPTAWASIAATAWAACPDRMLIAWVATHASAWGSPSAWKHQAAFHKYSRTWTGVDEDVDPHAAAGRFSAGQVQLMAGTVDQHHPGATVGRVALGGGGGDGDDIVGAAGGRGGVVDHPQGGHPFACGLLAAGQPGAIRPWSFRLGGVPGRLA